MRRNDIDGETSTLARKLCDVKAQSAEEGSLSYSHSAQTNPEAWKSGLSSILEVIAEW